MDPVTLGALVGGAGSVVGGISGYLQGKSQEAVNERRISFARRGANMLAPTDPDFIGQFQGLQGLASPFLNQIMAGQDLAGQQAAQSAQAGLARAGLGSTGLGASLGAGLRAGAAFQGNQLRARMLMDLLGMTQNIQAQRGSFLAGVPIQPVTQNAFSGALGGAGGALTALDAIGAFDKKQGG